MPNGNDDTTQTDADIQRLIQELQEVRTLFEGLGRDPTTPDSTVSQVLRSLGSGSPTGVGQSFSGVGRFPFAPAQPFTQTGAFMGFPPSVPFTGGLPFPIQTTPQFISAGLGLTNNLLAQIPNIRRIVRAITERGSQQSTTGNNDNPEG